MKSLKCDIVAVKLWQGLLGVRLGLEGESSVKKCRLIPMGFTACLPPKSTSAVISLLKVTITDGFVSDILKSVIFIELKSIRGLPGIFAHFVLFHLIKKCSFNLLCVLEVKSALI